MTKTTGTNDSYCNQKFWWLSVDLQRQQQFSCCSATPADIDLDWLAKNPGRLFNTPLLQQERQDMLQGKPVDSCWDTCYRAEQQGLKSRRQLENGLIRSHTDIDASTEWINVVIGTTCNLTCIYCCKQYSSSWTRDIQESGAYFNTDRFRLFENDKLRKHYDIRNDADFAFLFSELTKLSSHTVNISGGEPFLYNDLENLVERLPAQLIKINTGLGVDSNRFRQQLEKLKSLSNLQILVSGESLGDLYELVRYGNTFSRFEANLKILDESGIPYIMVNVISNLTLLGLIDYWQRYHHSQFDFLLCNDPDFLSVHVLDEHTKDQYIKIFSDSDHPAKQIVLDNIIQSPTAEQQQQFSEYLKEFVRRRELSLSMLPKSLIQWVENV